MSKGCGGWIGLGWWWGGEVHGKEADPPIARRVELILMGDARARGAAEGAPARTAPHFGAEGLAYGQEARSIELQMLARLQAPAHTGYTGHLLAGVDPAPTQRLARVSSTSVPPRLRELGRCECWERLCQYI